MSGASEVPAIPEDVRGLAHELWAMAQCGPHEGIEDAVERMAALLTARPVDTGREKALEGWQPIEKLHELLQLGEQADILFGSPEWGWPILGMVTRWQDALEWCLYDQERDKFVGWDSTPPTLFLMRPNLPPPSALANPENGRG